MKSLAPLDASAQRIEERSCLSGKVGDVAIPRAVEDGSQHEIPVTGDEHPTHVMDGLQSLEQFSNGRLRLKKHLTERIR